MPSISAKMKRASKAAKRRVVFVVYPGVKLLDFSGPYQVFADAPPLKSGSPPYEIVVTSSKGGAVATDTGIEISTAPFANVSRKSIDTLLVVGGLGAFEAANDQRLTEMIIKLSRKARRTGSICTGAFVLAGAGLLSGKRVVTHWKLCDQLAKQYPEIEVVRDPIFVNDRDVWTSAGVTSGIDLALAMVAEDLGRPTALAIARDLVSYMVRPGGQSQFSNILSTQIADSGGHFDRLHQWAAQNLTEDMSVENMAMYMGMAPRTFARLYVKHTNQSPAKAITAIRVDTARVMLEDGDKSISMIADQCGFGDTERLRRAFQVVLRVSPSEYRERFSTRAFSRAVK